MHYRVKNWGKIGEGSISLFGPRMTVQNFIEIESNLRPLECLQTE